MLGATMCLVDKEQGWNNESELLTAREFLEKYEPTTLDFLLDPETAFQQDTETAQRIATKLGAHYEGAKCPVWIWHLVYP